MQEYVLGFVRGDVHQYTLFRVGCPLYRLQQEAMKLRIQKKRPDLGRREDFYIDETNYPDTGFLPMTLGECLIIRWFQMQRSYNTNECWYRRRGRWSHLRTVSVLKHVGSEAYPTPFNHVAGERQRVLLNIIQSNPVNESLFVESASSGSGQMTKDPFVAGISIALYRKYKVRRRFNHVTMDSLPRTHALTPCCIKAQSCDALTQVSAMFPGAARLQRAARSTYSQAAAGGVVVQAPLHTSLLASPHR